MEKSSVRGWTLTAFGYTQEDCDTLVKMVELREVIDFVAQEELCEKTKRNHIQGYVRFKDNKTMSAVKKWFKKNGLSIAVANSLHLEPVKNVGGSIAYCNKDATYIQGGLRVSKVDSLGQGKRTDLETFTEAIKSGSKWKDIVNDNSELYLKFGRNARALYDLNVSKRDWKMDVQVLYGSSGAGKSREAIKYCKDNGLSYYMLMKGSNTVWWNEYDGENVVIIDDFFGDMKPDYLLRLLDRYPMQVETKGGMTEFRSTHVFMTSNKSPLDWYGEAVPMETRRAVWRRLDSVRCLTGSVTVDVSDALRKRFKSEAVDWVKTDVLCSEAAGKPIGPMDSFVNTTREYAFDYDY